MFPFKSNKVPASGFTRGQSLSLVPAANRDVRVSETPDGFIRLSLPVSVRPALAHWARRFGLWDGRALRKTVELDAMGSTVWRSLDGTRSVRAVAVILAERYQLDLREAELAVAQFLRQLGRRGAVAIVERAEEEEKNASGGQEGNHSPPGLS